MPCYFFTYHGHGTWMPDHVRGYVVRGKGIQKRSSTMGKRYREQQCQATIMFTNEMQQLIVDTLRKAEDFIDATMHAVATEPTHVHVQVSWRGDRTWKSMRASLRTALTKALNSRFGKREWFADQPSRKRVRDVEHFDYLLLVYVTKHKRVVWQRPKSKQDAEARDVRREVSVFERRRRRRSSHRGDDASQQ